MSEGDGCWYNSWLLSVVLMRVEMPDMNGISTTELRGSSTVQITVVKLGISDDVRTRVQAKEQQGCWRCPV
ncbi:MAG: hypothetical protein ACJ8AG_04765 [Ktedonobacteraceae bacterium]